jgi:acyl-CoA synthetase (NDP forming)
LTDWTDSTHGPAPGRLARALNARSVAIVGASADPAKIPGRPLAYMLARGFQGQLYPVNPGRQQVQGLRAYPSLAAIGRPVELAIVGTAAEQVEAVVAEGIAAGVQAFVVFSSGFAELGDEGRRLQQRLAARVRAAGVTLLGPNCLGIVNARSGLIASFTTALEDTPLRAGGFSLVSQSGALGAYWMDLVLRSGLGFDLWITTGNESDVDAAEAVELLVDAPHTRVIGLYLEQVRDVPAFRRALARAAAAGKPVLAIKAGRSRAGAAAAASHTGALAGDDALDDACLRQHGALRVDSLSAMADVARLFLSGDVPRGPRLAVMSVSGGAGVMIADAAEGLGLSLAAFGEATRQALREVLPPFVQASNPVDLTGQVVQDRSTIARALAAVGADGGVDAIVLFVGMMHSIADAFVDALAAARRQTAVPIVVIWFGALDASVQALEAAGLPVYLDIPQAMQALAGARRVLALQAQAQGQALPERPAAAPAQAARARAVSEWDGKQRLRAQAAVAVPRGVLLAPDRPPPADLDLHLDLSYPLAAKLQSAALLHKSDVGAVVLRIDTPRALAAALQRLQALGRELAIEVQGVLVEEMVGFDHELLLGLRRDPQFGPVLTLARGGVEVELDADAVTRLLPLDAAQVTVMLRSLRSARLLEGFRGRPAVDLPAVAAGIAGLCAWFDGQGDLLELEINPLALRGDRAWALDALVQVAGGDGRAGSDLS